MKKIALISCILAENSTPEFHTNFQKIALEKYEIQVDVFKNGELCFFIDQNEHSFSGLEKIPSYEAVFCRFAIRSEHSGDYYILRAFEGQGVPVINPTYSIINAKDKLFTLQTLVQNNLPVTPTLVVRNKNVLNEHIHRISGPPYIVKNCFGSGGKGVLLAYNHTQLASIFDYTWSQNRNAILLVQPFIKECDTHQDIRVLTLNYNEHYAIKRIASKDEYRTNISTGGNVEIVALTEAEKQLCSKVAQAMNLPFCGIDFLRTSKGPLILEVNSCPGLNGISSAYQGSVDIVEKIVTFVCHIASKTSGNKIRT